LLSGVSAESKRSLRSLRLSGEYMKIDLKSLNKTETEAFIKEQGLEPYRAKQIRQWIFKGLVTGFHEMTNIARKVRSQLEEQAYLANLGVLGTEVSKDRTTKFLFRLGDGHAIESVLIPERDHFTLCISSQAGCAMGCQFCLTGKQGLKRSLTASEIVDQVIQVKRFVGVPDRLTNIVLMGMGEPLANYDAVLKALNNIISEEGMNCSHHHVTLSTCGLVPEMERFGKDITVNLAVSLNAADDKSRTLLMPVNRKYPLKSLISACKEFPLPNRRMITFE
jgi:23S rRNA (adenine2503-C2)-methyltransferase